MGLCDKSSDCFGHEVEHWRRQSRIDANPKHIVHHKVRVTQLSGHAILGILVGRLPEEIATEEKARTDFVRFQRTSQILTSKWCILANANRKAKPRWVGVRGRFWQDQIDR